MHRSKSNRANQVEVVDEDDERGERPLVREDKEESLGVDQMVLGRNAMRRYSVRFPGDSWDKPEGRRRG